MDTGPVFQLPLDIFLKTSEVTHLSWPLWASEWPKEDTSVPFFLEKKVLVFTTVLQLRHPHMMNYSLESGGGGGKMWWN